MSFLQPLTHPPTHPPTPQYLEEFQKSESCGEWAFTVLRTPGSPAETRHYALQCLAALLKHQWKAWDENVRKQFRVAVMELMETAGAPGGNNGEVFMRERIALLVSGVGEKEYPQTWPGMLTDLAAIWTTGGTAAPTPTIVALLALRNLAEDCVDSDFNSVLPTARRTDILRTLNMELPTVLPRLFALMAQTYEGRATDPGVAAEILKAALQTLKRFVVWIPPDLLMRPEMSFIDVFGFLMAEEPTRLDAVVRLRFALWSLSLLSPTHPPTFPPTHP